MATRTQLNTIPLRKITDFKSKLSGGGTRSNLFEVELAFPAAINVDTNVLDKSRFLVKAAALPASNVTPVEVAFRGRTLKIAGDRTFDPWTITIINDTNYRIRNAFERWMNLINRHDDNAGVITPVAYQTDMKVFQLGRGRTNSSSLPNTSNTMPVLKSYKFYGCWPSDITPMDLSYDSSDTIQEFSVTLQYQWWDALAQGTNKSILGTSEGVEATDSEKDSSSDSNISQVTGNLNNIAPGVTL